MLKHTFFIISKFIREGGEIWEMVTSFLWGVTELRTVKDMEEGGVKKPGKSGDILYGQPLTIFCFASSKSLLTYICRDS